MNTYRKTAITVGVLFIIATVINVLGNVIFLRPYSGCPGLSHSKFLQMKTR